MNSYEKGKEFEEKVFKYFSSLLDHEQIPAASKAYSEIFWHKKYHTQTNREIVFDITIETYNPFAKKDQWSSLIVIECKCYNQKVNISDLDEFETKLHKVSNSGIKGIMVTSVGFSKEGINQAKDAHIGLVVLSKKSTEWLVSRDLNYKPENLMNIIQGNNQVGLVPVVYMNQHFGNVVDLLKSFGAIVSESNVVSVPYLSEKEIQCFVDSLYDKYSFKNHNVVRDVFGSLFPDIRFCFSDLSEGLLATLSLKENLITISNEIVNDHHRIQFTLAHELGHLFLHKNVLSSLWTSLKEYSNDSVANIPDNIIKRMEWQANTFASNLLMPKKIFLLAISRLFVEYNIHKGFLYLDNQQCNRNTVNLILRELSQEFNVSIAAVRIRMESENLLRTDCDEPIRLNHFRSVM